ncbi:hypothetical protein BOTBODRAFT_59182 [Botryobasidium botryosum FD-172 SS1]|uniref:Uncharacterized protein n=1 Tax=Botryobasidium botryosum (strain FD-172 SS1) TaxID=930990 RepID=A0A067LZJ2_BOTB1|nr:hypothetical protein BOTBODRAFT_59182 [Botryobasidium botryosum FD-172 SS1]
MKSTRVRMICSPNTKKSCLLIVHFRTKKPQLYADLCSLAELENHAPAEFRDERTVDVLCTTKHDHIIAVVPSVSFHPPKRSAFDQIRSPINDAAADYTALLQATIKRLENLGRALQGERKTSKDEEKELAQGLREERKARDKALREERSAREKALQEERKERQNLERRWEKQQSIANAEAAKARDECRAAKELSDGEIHTLRTEVNGLSDKVDELKSETAMLRSRVETNSSDISVVIDALGRFETIPDKTMIDLDKIARRALLDQAQALLAKAVG